MIGCRLLAIVASSALLSSCATPIGATRVDPRKVHRTLNTNVLSSGELSAPTQQLLHRSDFYDLYEKDPKAAFAALRERLRKLHRHAHFFAAAELAFQIAENESDRSYYLAAALYAYAFLFPEGDESPPNAYDPRFRGACDIYNRGLSEGLASPDGKEVLLRSGTYPLPFGELTLETDPAGFRWGDYELGPFFPAADFQVRGLNNRYRRAGLGAPLAAQVNAVEAQSEVERNWIPPATKVPVTALLTFPRPREALSAGQVAGQLELFAEYLAQQVEVDGRSVPLEYEVTTPLAFTLEDSSVWDFELKGFLTGDFGRPGNNGLFMLQPYLPGRVPVVLVHGTASSPARWTELVNELQADPVVRNGCQIWFFAYNTGNPIAWSAAELRDSLTAAVRELDPNGKDPALWNMVVIGHSQGGLLTKMTVVDSGTKFWDRVSAVPLDELGLSLETRNLVDHVMVVEPLPFVKRVVFVATPHRGSYLAFGWVRSIIEWFVSMPSNINKVGQDLRDAASRNPDSKTRHSLERLPNSVDNMTAKNPFLVTLASLPIDKGVHVHSIIAAEGEGPLRDLSDGVVRYDSAHIDDVDSELVVRSGHSTQAHPQTIFEVRRILHQHLGRNDLPAEPVVLSPTAP
jgi:pimeloyl-ACP methyl ester carboxylesterase